MTIIVLFLLLLFFGGGLFLLKALGWVVVTGFHLIGVLVLAIVIDALYLWWRKKHPRA